VVVPRIVEAMKMTKDALDGKDADKKPETEVSFFHFVFSSCFCQTDSLFSFLFFSFFFLFRTSRQRKKKKCNTG